jgi:hypothetical protein
MLVIRIDFACQFCGDFFHSGANNLANIPTMEAHQVINILKSAMISIKKGTTSALKHPIKLLSKSNLLHQVTRIFVRIYPKTNIDCPIAKKNLSFENQPV